MTNFIQLKKNSVSCARIIQLSLDSRIPRTLTGLIGFLKSNITFSKFSDSLKVTKYNLSPKGRIFGHSNHSCCSSGFQLIPLLFWQTQSLECGQQYIPVQREFKTLLLHGSSKPSTISFDYCNRFFLFFYYCYFFHLSQVLN